MSTCTSATGAATWERGGAGTLVAMLLLRSTACAAIGGTDRVPERADRTTAGALAHALWSMRLRPRHRPQRYSSARPRRGIERAVRTPPAPPLYFGQVTTMTPMRGVGCLRAIVRTTGRPCPASPAARAAPPAVEIFVHIFFYYFNPSQLKFDLTEKTA